ncbi:MAG: ribose 5-phosphate isomerase B [Acidobacteriota bacterium]
MIIAVGADHAGFALKELLKRQLEAQGHQIEDKGAFSEESVDYPEFAGAVASAVASGEAERGLLVCGTGIGIGIAANKVDGVRAATCNDLFTARMSREHNDANVLALGSRVVGEGVAAEIVKTFMESRFEAGRHQRRVEKIHALE